MSDKTLSSFDRAQSDYDRQIGGRRPNRPVDEDDELDKTEWLADIERDDNP